MRSLLGRFHRPNVRSQTEQLFMLNSLGDGSTLSLDFTTGVLDSRLTFTRADSGFASQRGASFVGSNGLIQYSAADTPRFDYDPINGNSRGLLIETTITNLLARSEDMTTIAFPGWGNRQNLTSVTSGFTSPDGNTTAVKIIPNATPGSMHYLGTGTLVATVQSYTYSCFVKASGYTVVGLVATASQSRASFDLSSGSSAGYGISNTRAITPYPGNWYRISMTWTATVSTPDFWIVVQNTLQDPVTGWTGNTTDGILAWGAQLETTSNGPTSYIPTAAGTVTRATDTAIISAGTAFNGWYTGGLNGTFFADWYGGFAGASGTQRSVLATDDVTNKHLHLYQAASATGTGVMTLANFGGGSTVVTSNGITSAGARSKSAFSYATSAMNICLNGGTVASGTVTGFTVAPTWLSLGGPSTSGTAITGTTVMLNNSIRAIKYWPTVLPNATLQSLTA